MKILLSSLAAFYEAPPSEKEAVGPRPGKANGNYRSGIWTKEWLKLRREAAVLRRQARLIIP
jgi:hypothetical protein